VKLDGTLIAGLSDVGQRVRDLEDLGYDGAVSVDTSHDPFLPLLLAAEHSRRLELITGVAIAFARNPMSTAYVANDIQAHSQGRLRLGLGSQVRPHIERRFSMPWSHPAPRMREYITAMRAIWRSWATGEKLDFRGDFYQHTLMTPFFNPGANPHGPPPVFLGALGERMAEVAGEVADGIMVHPMATERFIRECTVPALTRGLARAGRSRDGFEICLTPFIVSGADEEAISGSRTVVRQQIAFYGSTPAYRSVLDLHGCGELQGELNLLSKQGRWTEMGELISDDMLAVFAVEAPLDVIAAAVRERVGDIADRLSFYLAWEDDRDRWRGVIEALRQGTRAEAVSRV